MSDTTIYINADTCYREIQKLAAALDSAIASNPGYISSFSQDQRNRIKWQLEETKEKIYSPYTSVYESEDEVDEDCIFNSSEE